MKNENQLFNLFQLPEDTPEDLAIEEFLRTPIDSRTTSVDPEFKLSPSSPLCSPKRKKQSQTSITVMKQWEPKIHRYAAESVVHKKTETRHFTIGQRNITTTNHRSTSTVEEIANSKQRPPVLVPINRSNLGFSRKLPDQIMRPKRRPVSNIIFH